MIDMHEIFTGALSQPPHIDAGKLPEQLLGSFTCSFSMEDTFLSCAGGGLIQTVSPLFYEFNGMPCHLLLYTLTGSGRFTDASGMTPLTEGTLLFWDCRAPFKLNIVSSSWDFYLFFLTGPAVSSYYNYFTKTGRLYQVPVSSGIPSYLESLLKLSPIDSPARCLSVHKWLTDILTELCVVNLNRDLPEEHIPAYLLEMKKLFDQFFERNYSLKELEEQFGISKYRLCREFSTHFHIPPLQYLNARRIEAAKDLLLTTDMPVHEAGSAVGIENTNHFINLFKKYTGTTPFVYKQGAPASMRALHSPYRPESPLR